MNLAILSLSSEVNGFGDSSRLRIYLITFSEDKAILMVPAITLALS